MTLLDGNALADAIKQELAAEVSLLKAENKRPPHLAAVIVGDDPASQAYVRNKVRACEQVGFSSTLLRLEASTTEVALLDIIHDLNRNEEIDGFIVQLPLPKHIDEVNINLAIDYRKDVDGFHPMNFGKMSQGMPAYLPATPYGILVMLDRYGIPTAGKHCVVVGRSNIVGTPISILLSRKGRDCTVTMTHSRTVNLPDFTRHADILIAAIGSPEFITADMVKEGAIVIDVGMNRVEDTTRKSGYRLTGDVRFEEVAPKCSYITPVPGGVGPLTVMGLLLNTMKAYRF